MGRWSVQKHHDRSPKIHVTWTLLNLPEATIHLRLHLRGKDFGVSVDGRHKTEAHRSTNGLGNLALVDWAQSSLFAVLDTTERGNVFGHDGEVLESDVQVSVIVSEEGPPADIETEEKCGLSVYSCR